MYLGGNRLWVPLQQVVGQPSRWASDLQAPIARAGLPVYALIPPSYDENLNSIVGMTYMNAKSLMLGAHFSRTSTRLLISAPNKPKLKFPDFNPPVLFYNSGDKVDLVNFPSMMGYFSMKKSD